MDRATGNGVVESRQRLEAGEPLKVVFDHIKCGLAYVIDAAEMHEIPASVICGVPEGHVFATDVAHSSEEKMTLSPFLWHKNLWQRSPEGCRLVMSR